MRNVFNHVGNRVAALALGGAVILAGSALAFTQKEKAEVKSLPNIPLDERPISRDLGGHNSFAPVVKKVTPAVVKVYTKTRIRNTSYNSNNGFNGNGNGNGPMD